MATQGKNHEAIKKAVLLLSELTRKSGPSGVTELARALDMPKATVHRILGILCEDNVVVKTADGRYKVGPTVLLWSGGYRYSTAVIELAAPWLRRLRDATNETVHLCVYNNGAAQYADRLDSTQNVTLRWSRSFRSTARARGARYFRSCRRRSSTLTSIPRSFRRARRGPSRRRKS